MELVHSGKVRDVYADGDELILVATDRVSVYDVVLPTPIPDKGKILTQLSLWWFEPDATATAAADRKPPLCWTRLCLSFTGHVSEAGQRSRRRTRRVPRTGPSQAQGA